MQFLSILFHAYRGVGRWCRDKAGRRGSSERRGGQAAGWVGVAIHAVQNVAPSRRQDAEDKDENEDDGDEDEDEDGGGGGDRKCSVGTSARADQYNR